MAKKEEGKTIKVTLVRSPIGYPQPQKLTIQALGFHHLNETVEHKDTPALRGMLAKVVHLIRVEE
ncbi:MAG TPA: 50S ribosomal protein L30 [Anaerolineales bacterium]|nr:50S ribosomal protein L30 [Anaerolineales bacterium]